MKHFQKHEHILNVLKDAKPKLRTAILQQCDDGVICILAEIIVNLMEGRLKMTPTQKQKLKPYRHLFAKITRRCSKKHSAKALRKDIVNQKGGFLPFLLPLVPLIAKAALGGAVSAGVGLAAKKVLGG